MTGIQPVISKTEYITRVCSQLAQYPRDHAIQRLHDEIRNLEDDFENGIAE